ncbi:hypothetical protein F5B17DRAFT_397692 [Nemania serpens]|nr:hypothetical protein F5B17DRAFT_397692 [Nemania serpens]
MVRIYARYVRFASLSTLLLSSLGFLYSRGIAPLHRRLSISWVSYSLPVTCPLYVPVERNMNLEIPDLQVGREPC